MKRRRSDGGMTLTELMVVLVIIGIITAMSRPLFTRDRMQREGQEFSALLARDFQRARFLAIAERMPLRAFVFSNRVEYRMAVADANPTVPPRPAVLTDPILRVLMARDNVTVWDVKTTVGAPASQVLSTATHKIIEFSSNGQARMVGATTTLVSIYVRNAHRGVTPAERRFRVDIAPLTGHVSLGENW